MTANVAASAIGIVRRLVGMFDIMAAMSHKETKEKNVGENFLSSRPI
jgi:hypothetical protein